MAAGLLITTPATGTTLEAAPGPVPGGSAPSSWHVSPLVDTLAYHLSWAWILIPLSFVGDDQHVDYRLAFAVVLGVNFAHRHFGLPYAYLDRQVFAEHRRRLLGVPLLLLALFALTPWLLDRAVFGGVGPGFVSAAVFIAVLWNFWHTPMQKFGILRLYLAKSGLPLDRRAPPWVDRLLVLCWFPLLFTYVGPTHKALIFKYGGSVSGYTRPLIAFLEQYAWLLLPPSIALVVGAIAAFLYHEWRANRMRSWPRLSMGLGTTLGFSALLWAHPVKAYIALAFSHAVEYMVFVWAFQRRRYSAPDAPPGLMRTLLRRPVAFYFVLGAGLFAISTYEFYFARKVITGVEPMRLGGLSFRQWFFYYAAYESMIHFYTDGFLWKMRSRAVQRAI